MRTPYSTFSSRGMEQWRWTPVAPSTSGSLTPTRAQVESRGMNSRLVLLFTRDRTGRAASSTGRGLTSKSLSK
jgi:hypothetical protein